MVGVNFKKKSNAGKGKGKGKGGEETGEGGSGWCGIEGAFFGGFATEANKCLRPECEVNTTGFFCSSRFHSRPFLASLLPTSCSPQSHI